MPDELQEQIDLGDVFDVEEMVDPRDVRWDTRWEDEADDDIWF